MSHKYVYLFNEGNATMRNLLGGKGANLAEMTGQAFQPTRMAIMMPPNGIIRLELT